MPKPRLEVQIEKSRKATHLSDSNEVINGLRSDSRTLLREFAELRKSGLKTARAWALKETAMALYSYTYKRPARKHFRWWHNWAVRSRLKPILEVARMLKRRFENIITYLTHRITNAASESLNAKIQWVKYTARGFRNKQNFIHAIYFHCGDLDLAPSATK